jgi:hypothetical protein
MGTMAQNTKHNRLGLSSMRNEILTALRTDAEGNIQKARLNIEIYLKNPVGIGEHPDVLGAIQEQLDIIAHEQERIDMLQKYFS